MYSILVISRNVRSRSSGAIFRQYENLKSFWSHLAGNTQAGHYLTAETVRLNEALLYTGALNDADEPLVV